MQLKTFAVAALAGVAVGSPVEPRQNSGGGDGPFKPAKYTTESSLPGHTVYVPSGSTGSTKMPIVVWGNGGCGADGLSNRKMLEQIASYGYLVVSSGAPGGQGSTTAKQMTDSIDWATSQAGKGAYANVDANKVMAAGWSCGGVEAYAQIWDTRVKTVGIFSSGLLDNQTAAEHFQKPLLYCMGGPSDIAYNNGERDYNNLPAGVPAWKGNINVGHGGTYNDPNGGKFAKAAVNWLQWIFRDDTKAAAYFTTNEAQQQDGWEVQSKSLDKLKPIN